MRLAQCFSASRASLSTPLQRAQRAPQPTGRAAHSSAPAIHLLTRRFFLTLAIRERQQNKATGRGCRTRQPRGGFIRPRRPRDLLESLAGLSMGPHGPGGLPSGTRVRRFVSRSGLWLPAHVPVARGAQRPHKSSSQQPAAWHFSQRRSDRTGPPGLGPATRDQPSRRRSPATLGVGTDVPSQAGDASSMRPRGVAGINPCADISRMVNSGIAAALLPLPALTSMRSMASL